MKTGIVLRSLTSLRFPRNTQAQQNAADQRQGMTSKKKCIPLVFGQISRRSQEEVRTGVRNNTLHIWKYLCAQEDKNLGRTYTLTASQRRSPIDIPRVGPPSSSILLIHTSNSKVITNVVACDFGSTPRPDHAFRHRII